MNVDFLIVGQGLAGTFLHYNLTLKGYKVLVIDTAQPHTASKIASGVINPVTGRRLSATWMIDTLMPFAENAYTKIASFLGVDSFIAQKNTVSFFPTPQMQLAFEERLPNMPYLQMENDTQAWRQFFNFPFGVGYINPCYWVHVNGLLQAYRQYLQHQNLLIPSVFSTNNLVHNPNGIVYENIVAEKIFFCDGAANADNIFFKMLPYAKNKGEAIIAKIPNLPTDNLYKMSLTLVPWQQDLWWIGSTYEWQFENVHPTAAFKQTVETSLNNWLKIPYTLFDHFAAERPANLERRPFVGLHPVYKNIGILNGLGTKGCSLAPFFANELANHIHSNQPIEPLANVQRFQKILSK